MFDYDAPAELFMAKRKGGSRQPLAYRRFTTAAEAIRFAIEDSDRQARYASVFAITAGAFVPLNFIAVRMAEAYTHPRVLSATGGQMPGEMRLTFIVALIAVALLFTTLWRLELAGKAAAARLRHLRQAPPVSAVPARSSPR